MKTIENLLWAIEEIKDQEMLDHFAWVARQSVLAHCRRAQIKMNMRREPRTVLQYFSHLKIQLRKRTA